MSLLSALIATSTLLLADDDAARLLTVEDLVARIGPRTVALQIERLEPEKPPVFGRDFRERLESLGPEERENLQAYFRRPEGLVTGFLIDDEGHVLTSSYNASGSIKRITAFLANGTEAPATFVARDLVADLGLLKIPAQHLEDLEMPPLQWAHEEDYRAGHLVVSVGRSPSPQSPTVTLGIMSAPARQYGRVFQTDAALNYGNVGGPLLNIDGRVLGVAAYVGHTYPLWGMNSGIGFGVRADTLREILPHLKNGRSVEGPAFLGVHADLDREVGFAGAAVKRVVPDLPAANGGLEALDVIVEFGGEEVRDFGHLRELIFWKRPGDRVLIKVRREDATVELAVTLALRPEEI